MQALSASQLETLAGEAETLLAAQDYQAALAVLKRVWDAPEGRQPWNALRYLRACRGCGKPELADEMLASAFALWPENPFIVLAAAESAFRNGNDAEASRIATGMLSGKGAPLGAYLLMSRIYGKNRQFDLASAVLDQAEAALGSSDQIQARRDVLQKDLGRVAPPTGGAGVVETAEALLREKQFAAARDLLLAEWGKPEVQLPAVALRLVRAHRGCGGDAEADELLRVAVERWPDDVQIKTEAAHREFYKGNMPEARRLVRELIAKPKAPLAAFLLFAQIHLRFNDWDKALEVLARAEEKHGAAAGIGELRAKAIKGAGQVTDYFAELLRAVDNSTASAIDCANLVQFACLNGRGKEIVERQQLLRAVFAGDQGRYALAVCALIAAGVLPESSAPAFDATSGLSDAARKDGCALAHALITDGKPAVAVDFLTRALALDSGAGDLRGVLLLARAALPEGPESVHAAELLEPAIILEGKWWFAVANQLLALSLQNASNAELAELIKRFPTPELQARKSTEVLEVMLTTGQKERAIAWLSDMDFTSLTPVQRIRCACVAGLLGADSLGPKIEGGFPAESFEDGAIKHYRFGTDYCLVWFGGLIPSSEAVRAAYCLPVLKDLGISVLLIQDLHREAALRGFGSHYPDLAASEAALQRLLAQLGYRQWAGFANSLAGLSAFRYVAKGGARGILSMAGFTYRPNEQELPGTGQMLHMHRVRRLHADLTDDVVSWKGRDLLQANPGVTVHHYFCKDVPFDLAQAQHIDGLPNVRCIHVPDGKHDVLERLRQDGRVADVFESFLSELNWLSPVAKPKKKR